MMTRTPRVGSRWIYQPVGLDIWRPCGTLERNERVTVVQPHGCPKNGTMGHVYVQADGGYPVLVMIGSLAKPVET